MWVRTQDRKQVVNVIRVSISGALGKHKAVIFGNFAGATFFHENNAELGSYRTMEAALEELDRLQEFFISNPNAVYQMRQSD